MKRVSQSRRRTTVEISKLEIDFSIARYHSIQKGRSGLVDSKRVLEMLIEFILFIGRLAKKIYSLFNCRQFREGLKELLDNYTLQKVEVQISLVQHR